MRFEVLGPLRVWRGESELDLGFPQQRALLGLLLLHTGRPVQMHAIVDALWPEQPPVSALNVVRRYAGSLRRLLEPGLPPRAPGRRLLRRTGGYLLAADRDEVDLLRFRDLTRQGKRAVATGRPDVAVGHFADALGQWRGRVALGLPASTRAHVQFAGVERELVETAQMAADAALLCGRAAEVLPAVRRAAELDSLNEALHARLVLTLAGCGLRAEALTAYEETRRRLAAELGVTPGPELGAAHARVLREPVRPTRRTPDREGGAQSRRERLTARSKPSDSSDSSESSDFWDSADSSDSGEGPFVPPAQLPPDLAVFCGRRAELGGLTAVADAAVTSAGAPATILVSGMAGIGKTTLAVHWAHEAAARFPDGQLHVALRGFDPARPALEPAEALRGMLAALGVPARHVPDGVDARAGLYRSLLAGRRVLVLLDDAADTEQVRPLLPASPGCLALVTTRKGLPSLIASGAHPVRLELPSAADALAALALRIGRERLAAEPRAADEIVARCGRLPLALAIAAARAGGRRDLPLAAVAAELRVSAGSLDAFTAARASADARVAFLCSYRLLSPESARLFRLLSLHPGPDIEAVAATALTDLPPRKARAALGELADAHLVTEHAPGRYILHDLLRAFSAELTGVHDSPAERRAARLRLSGSAPGVGTADGTP
ncbi:BTAD domain-containing putative transcriptional regulator [Streptomyces sp. NPDC001315]|uniref:AfsR/SARP family transcriptional regulator n=1 Tax=Streptomyces sp. NPDC001315 TaxID=3364562 RepID=UPI0036B3129B